MIPRTVSKLFMVFSFVIGMAPATQAAIVDADTSISFLVDTSGRTTDRINTWFWRGTGDSLAEDAAMRVSFGTTVGGTELTSFVKTNPFKRGIFGFSAGQGLPDLPAIMPSSYYITFGFVDDTYDVFKAGQHFTRVINGSFVAETFESLDPIQVLTNAPVAPVPLPATLPLFTFAILAVGWIGRRKMSLPKFSNRKSPVCAV